MAICLVIFLFLMFCGLCIAIYLCNKNQQDALFYSQFISIINLYMFWAGLLLIIRRYSVYEMSWHTIRNQISSSSEMDESI